MHTSTLDLQPLGHWGAYTPHWCFTSNPLSCSRTSTYCNELYFVYSMMKTILDQLQSIKGTSSTIYRIYQIYRLNLFSDLLHSVYNLCAAIWVAGDECVGVFTAHHMIVVYLLYVLQPYCRCVGYFLQSHCNGIYGAAKLQAKDAHDTFPQLRENHCHQTSCFICVEVGRQKDIFRHAQTLFITRINLILYIQYLGMNCQTQTEVTNSHTQLT